MQSAVWVWLIDNIVVKEWVKKLFSSTATQNEVNYAKKITVRND